MTSPATPQTRPARRRRAFHVAGVLCLGMILMWKPLIRWLSPRPANLGVQGGRLADCPASPNCVCSHAAASDATHAIAPLSVEGDPAAAFARLRSLAAAQPGATLVEERPDYLRFEFATPLAGFLDDVEFLLDPPSRAIHLRSASRLGHSDLGANRRRMEQLRAAFSAAAAP